MSEIGGTDIHRIAGVKPQMDDTDKVAVSIYGESAGPGDTSIEMRAANADGQGSVAGLVTRPFLYLFNDSTWDRFRNNMEFTVLGGGVRNSSTNSADFINYNAKGIMLFFNVPDVPGTDTVSLEVHSKDPVSGIYDQLFVAAAISTASYETYVIYPGATDTNSILAGINDIPLCRTFRVRIVHSGSGNFTYSVGACLIN